MISEKQAAAAAAQLNRARSAVIFCHARPDGDALGSGMALCLAMRGAGKRAYLCCEDTVPEKFGFLPALSDVRQSVPEGAFDTFIAVDCADISRLGSLGQAFSGFRGETVNIDHHVSNTGYANVNCVCECSATCEIMPGIFAAAGFSVTPEIADLLMLGLMTDSGSFTHNDVTAHTFEVAACLRAAGANVTEINYRMFAVQKKQRALLFRRALANLRFALEDRLAFLSVSARDLKETGADRSMTEGFVDYPLTIDGVEVSVSLLEMKPGQFKASLRSKGKVNVNAVASSFGGGGHVLASGCMLFGEYEEVVDRLTYAVFQHL